MHGDASVRRTLRWILNFSNPQFGPGCAASTCVFRAPLRSGHAHGCVGSSTDRPRSAPADETETPPSPRLWARGLCSRVACARADNDTRVAKLRLIGQVGMTASVGSARSLWTLTFVPRSSRLSDGDDEMPTLGTNSRVSKVRTLRTGSIQLATLLTWLPARRARVICFASYMRRVRGQDWASAFLTVEDVQVAA